MQIYVGNDGLLYLLELQNAASDAYINSATVTAQLKLDGVDVGSPIVMAALGSSVAATVNGRTYVNGNYRGVIEEDVAIVEGRPYECHINVDAGSDLKGHWEVPVSAVTRRG